MNIERIALKLVDISNDLHESPSIQVDADS